MGMRLNHRVSVAASGGIADGSLSPNCRLRRHLWQIAIFAMAWGSLDGPWLAVNAYTSGRIAEGDAD